MINKVHHGYVPGCLKELQDGLVNCVVTSPPYWGLRLYEGVEPQVWADGSVSCLGLEPTPEEYVAHLVEVFSEVKRVLRDDGTIWVVIGDSYTPQSTHRAKSERGGSNQKGREVKDEVQFPPYKKEKDLVGVPWMLAFALRESGWYLRAEIIWEKVNPMTENVADRPTRSHETVFLMSKSMDYWYDNLAIMEKTVDGKDLRNRRTVWSTVTKDANGENHSATFPRDLIAPMILAGCPEGGIVLDPFAGTGTTVVVAMGLGRKGIGFDASQKYVGEIADVKVKAFKSGLTPREVRGGQLTLFGEVE
jgi:site-specific DNA-methyltransferase (adenine-specific)/site-specific DNA-methyltransferase (cytosine-N4-specific)